MHEPLPSAPSRTMTPAGAVRFGIVQACGAPAVVMSASFVGFGALARQSDFLLGHALLSTASGWALPGQVALVELYAAGASILAIALAVALVNARLLPMTVTLLPLLRARGTPRWRYYAAAHLVAVTGWAAAMRDCPRMPARARLPFYFAFAGTLYAFSMAATAAGFLLAGSVPTVVSLGLVFVNPIYFMLVFAGDVRRLTRGLSLAFGAVLGPPLHLLAPTWGLLITGMAAGSAGYALARWWERRRG